MGAMDLTDLVVKYHVGINVVQTLNLYKVDSDYYEEWFSLQEER